MAQLDTATDDRLGQGAWGLGPTSLARHLGKTWVYAALLDNVWSVSKDDARRDVNRMLLQPLVNCNFPDAPGRYLSFSPVIAADWEADSRQRWTVPLGLGIGQIPKVGAQPVNLQAAACCNVERPDVATRWQMRLQARLLFPKWSAGCRATRKPSPLGSRQPRPTQRQCAVAAPSGRHPRAASTKTEEHDTMNRTLSTRLAAALERCCTFAAVACVAVAAQAQPAGIDPQAQRLLKASTDFLAGQQKLSAETRNSLEVVLESGQKIEFNHMARMSAQRPDRLRAERTGDLVDQLFIYDGKSLVLHNPQANVFAQVAAPDTLEGVLDFARSKLDLYAPAGDLLFKNAYDILMDGVTDGFVVGKAMVEGVRCDHLAFRAPHVDLQIWVQEGAQPLPRRFVITTRDLPNAPQFAVTITQWNLQPQFDDRTFRFSAPAGAQRVEFLPR